MNEDRRIIIAFTDGTDMQFKFPKQFDDPNKIVSTLRKTLDENQLVLAVEGAMYTIPYNNIKYIRVSPCPPKLPDTAILEVRIEE